MADKIQFLQARLYNEPPIHDRELMGDATGWLIQIDNGAYPATDLAYLYWNGGRWYTSIDGYNFGAETYRQPVEAVYANYCEYKGLPYRGIEIPQSPKFC